MKIPYFLIGLTLVSIVALSVNAYDELSDEIASNMMYAFLPHMFRLFRDKTDPIYRESFTSPCKFDEMLELFQTLPPYFEQFAKKYPNNTELVAYYSMQAASSVLVNNGSLTMSCLYRMLSLQTRIMDFSLQIMDKPKENKDLVGEFGLYMHPLMSKLKNANVMMKIIEHVDKYDKNDNFNNVYLFNFLNIVYCVLGIGAILSNIFLIVLLKQKPKNVNSSSGHSSTIARSNRRSASSSNTPANHRASRTIRNRKISTYDYLIQSINNRYKTRICLIIIAVCHSLYIFINFMVMSQAGLASVALKGLTQFNLACKIAFFLFPPTTIYTILHQFAIWLLIFAIRKHSIKIRRIRQQLVANYDLLEQTTSLTKPVNAQSNSNTKKNPIYMSDSVMDEFSFRCEDSCDDENMPRISNRPHPTAYLGQKTPNKNMKRALSYTSMSYLYNESCFCYFFSPKRQNALFCLFLFVILLTYNFQNFLFYSLTEMKDPKTNRQVTICAFDDYYTPVFGLVNQYLSPIFNLFFFSFLPLLIGGVQFILDMAYLRRLKREQKKFYIKLNEDHIEWPLYAYFAAYFIVLLPLFFHQVIELVLGTKKFPFVFPLFIQLKFSSAVPLVVTEMTLLFLLCAADLFIWLCVDKNLKLLAKLWLKRYIFCKKSKAIKKQQITTASSGSSTHSGSTPTPNSDNTESSSAKTSSEMCAIQDTDPAKMNLLGVGGIKMNKDSGTSSNGTNTLTSNASVLMMTNNKSKKQLILPNLTDAIKQTAAIPASIQHTSVYPYETSLETNERNFKMIDTDIDHMCDDDYDLDNNNDIDNVNDEDIVANVYVTNEEIQKAVAVGQSMRSYKSNYENVNPPSFKTAINQLNNNNNNNSNSPGKD